MGFRSIIDPPDAFAPLKEWEEFLAQVKGMPQDDDAVKLARQEAETRIAEIKAQSDSAA